MDSCTRGGKNADCSYNLGGCFFSSRRRHTRLQGDWSSDVCSSDLTVEYDAKGKVVRVDAVVISTQHAETVTNDELRAGILKHVIQAVIPAQWLDEYTQIGRASCRERV